MVKKKRISLVSFIKKLVSLYQGSSAGLV